MSARPEDRLLARICGAVSYGLGLHCTLEQAEIVKQHLRTAGFVIEQDWSPIETAPRDGTAVLCWPFNYSSVFEGKAEPEIVIGFFSEDDWWCESTVAKTFDPTHWRPLPTSPQ